MKLTSYTAAADSMPISCLFSTAKADIHPENYQAIKTSIKERGLDFPIVVWRTTVLDWWEWWNHSPDLLGPSIRQMDDYNAIVFLVMCGNNRLKAAKELGYTHIDALVKKNLQEISAECSRQRKDWRLKTQKD